MNVTEALANFPLSDSDDHEAIGVLRLAAGIVVALAAIEPIGTDQAEDPYCVLCMSQMSFQEHRPACPWRQAKEWVQEHGPRP